MYDDTLGLESVVVPQHSVEVIHESPAFGLYCSGISERLMKANNKAR